MTETEDRKIKYRFNEKGNIDIGDSKPTKEQKRCNAKDCESKKLILNKMMNNSLTSTQLWHLIKGEYDAKYKTFTSLLVRYQRYGYITKHGKKPYIYQLTEWGIENAKNPFMNREEQKRRYKEFQMGIVGQYLNENPDYLRGIADDSGYIGGSDCGVRVVENSEFLENHVDDDKINELESKVKELEEDKETLEYQLQLVGQNRPKMVVNQAPQQPQKEPEPEPQSQKSNERKFDYILWNFKDKMMDYSAYKKLPSQIVKLIAFPKTNVSESIRNMLSGKKKGGFIVVQSRTVPTMANYGLVEPLCKELVESLIMRFINGKVFLISPSGMRFEITDVPKSLQTKPQQQNKPVAKPRKRVSIKVK